MLITFSTESRLPSSESPWETQYSEMLFHIKNPESFDYDNFDAEISTNLVIGELRQLRGLSDCKIAGTHQPLQVH
jgi:hypothetical protein